MQRKRRGSGGTDVCVAVRVAHPTGNAAQTWGSGTGDGVDVELFDVSNLVPAFETKYERLQSERRDHLASFPALRQEIVDAVY